MNAIRLLSEFHGGSLTLADTWRRTLDPANATTVLTLAPEAGRLADAASRRLGLGGESDTVHVDTLAMAEALAGFHFPDELWARVVYDLVLATRRGESGPGRWSRRWCRSTSAGSGASSIENRHLDHRRRRGARGAAGARVRAAQAVPRRALAGAPRPRRLGPTGAPLDAVPRQDAR